MSDGQGQDPQGSGTQGNPHGAAQAPPSTGSPGQPNSGEELVPIGRLRDLQGSNDRLRNTVAELERRVGESCEAIAAAKAAADAAGATALGERRRALLAEHAGRVVPELVTGSTVEELEASIAA